MYVRHEYLNASLIYDGYGQRPDYFWCTMFVHFEMNFYVQKSLISLKALIKQLRAIMRWRLYELNLDKTRIKRIYTACVRDVCWDHCLMLLLYSIV